MIPRSWLADVVLVNDSPDWSEPGDVFVFRNFDDARNYLEHWSDEPELGTMSGLGERLIIVPDEHGNVDIADRQVQPDGEEVVRRWLRHMADAIHASRRHRSTKRWRRTYLGDAERAGVLPETVEGLIAYIGFTI